MVSGYKVGDVLAPYGELIRTGFSQIYHIDCIPDNRLSLYSKDGSVKELYRIYTDFGNTFILTAPEIDELYEVSHNEDISDRMSRWENNVNRVVNMYKEMYGE